MSEETKTGTVKWFNNSKGYGFITPTEGGSDLFVHMSSIVMEGYKTLSDNQKVSYQVGTSDRGPVATNVMI
jgi:CspA family cold shock protein|tara:strand:- start:392 stop:604 length:213 start_codon:yes stop_codon:yes gene_type:complete